jgi:hypothetical protein
MIFIGALQPGDIVAVNVPTGQTVRKEGLVVGTHYDHTVRVPSLPPLGGPRLTSLSQGRQILEIQFDRGEYVHAPCVLPR